MRARSVIPIALIASACLIAHSVEVEPVAKPERAGDSVVVTTPVKAHLVDGATVVFADGVRVVRDTVWGSGFRYDIALRDSADVEQLPLDSVVGLEAFRTTTDPSKTALYSSLATLGTIGAVIAIACISDPKCFGSCPTYYSDSSGTAVLEAEGFSYSVAPLFEARDVDRLRTQPRDGALSLEVRNEAFETHYINHLQLLEVQHSAAELALPDQDNRPIVVDGFVTPAQARDRQGRDVRTLLQTAEGTVYRTDPRTLAHADSADLDDWIDVTVPVPSGADSVALVLRLRNSLLNTILFYDIMLGDPGARSLDWISHDLEQVGPAVELAQWYQRRMGMRIAVRGPDGFAALARLKDTGPVAWKDVGIVVPVLERDSVRLRLSFPADNWRIDRVAVASRFRHPAVTAYPLAEVRDAREQVDTAARASLAAADQRYLVTTGGSRFSVTFATGDAPPGARRTFFLESQGYYSEWVRSGWLTAPRTTSTFRPSDARLGDAIARWRVTQDTLEARFMATRVPVR